MARTLKIGMSGEDVKDLIRKLVSFQHLRDEPARFDDTVQIAVKDFQSRHLDVLGHPLVVDGVVGPVTRWALDHPTHVFPELNRGRPALEDLPLELGQALHVAALRVAYNEMADGAGEEGANNSGPHVQKYLDGLATVPANWCAALVSWCFQKSGDMPFTYSLGARNIRQQFMAKGWAYAIGEKDPAPGDLVFWWRGRPEGWQGHIGFAVLLKDGILYTVEGNKGPYPARVAIFDYVYSRMDNVLGFGRIKE